MASTLDLIRRAGEPASAPTRPERAVLVTLRDLGMTHAANVAVYAALDSNIASAQVAVPCPWAREASSRYSGQDVGVQLTLNAQHALYRWGPIVHAPSLVDGNGAFPETVDDLWEHADLDEVRRECRAQIERAKAWGFDVTHLVSHLDVLALRPEFFDVLIDLALEYGLPLSLPGPEASLRAGFPLRDLAREEGILFPDQTVDLMHTSPTMDSIEAIFETLGDGITELRFSPTINSPEVETLSPNWQREVAQYDFLTASRPDGTGGGSSIMSTLAAKHAVEMLTFSTLRDAQRALDPTQATARL